jgi:hypothetical protein
LPGGRWLRVALAFGARDRNCGIGVRGRGMPQAGLHSVRVAAGQPEQADVGVLGG